jgi:hypothetical protein
MSGRKSSEVASILKTSEEKQDEIIKKYTGNTEKVINQCEEILEKLKENNSEILKIKDSIKKYNVHLSKNRNRSKEIRDNIRNKSHYCDSEYNEAKKLKKENDAIEGGFSKSYIESTQLLTSLNSKYQKKLEKFWDNEVQKIEERLQCKDYYDLKKHYIENVFIEISIEEFLRIYGNSNKGRISKIKDFLESSCPQNIEEAARRVNNINETLGILEEEALKIKTKSENESLLCASIYDAMEEMGFIVNYIPMVEGEIITGYKLECKNGDNIDFTSIKLGENGEPIIEIDHTHGRNYNNCVVKWKDIKDSFNRIGIPVTTIKKNGKDLLFKDKTRTKSISKSTNRGER